MYAVSSENSIHTCYMLVFYSALFSNIDLDCVGTYVSECTEGDPFLSLMATGVNSHVVPNIEAACDSAIDAPADYSGGENMLIRTMYYFNLIEATCTQLSMCPFCVKHARRIFLYLERKK